MGLEKSDWVEYRKKCDCPFPKLSCPVKGSHKADFPTGVL